MKSIPTYRFLPFLCLIFFSLTCEKTKDDVSENTEQKVFFEVSYINYSFGKQVKGFLIGKNGEIKIYDNELKFKNKTSYPSAEMDENLASISTTKEIGSPSDFKKYTSYASQINSNLFSKRLADGNDKGGTMYYAYVLDKSNNMYNSILLAETGDFKMQNLDPKAIEITRWLQQIQLEAFQ